jgi:hypothetical protein
MRTSLLHPLREPRHSRRHRRARAAAKHEPSSPIQEPLLVAGDPAVRRVREAGGPIDRASYTCACGYLFSATVSTTVMCPHCGTDQAW